MARERLANNYNNFLQPFALLVDIVNLDAGGERFADWQYFAYGKQLEALGILRSGDQIEFNAAIDGDELKRPTRLTKIDGVVINSRYFSN